MPRFEQLIQAISKRMTSLMDFVRTLDCDDLETMIRVQSFFCSRMDEKFDMLNDILETMVIGIVPVLIFITEEMSPDDLLRAYRQRSRRTAMACNRNGGGRRRRTNVSTCYRGVRAGRTDGN